MGVFTFHRRQAAASSHLSIAAAHKAGHFARKAFRICGAHTDSAAADWPASPRRGRTAFAAPPQLRAAQALVPLVWRQPISAHILYQSLAGLLDRAGAGRAPLAARPQPRRSLQPVPSTSPLPALGRPGSGRGTSLRGRVGRDCRAKARPDALAGHPPTAPALCRTGASVGAAPAGDRRTKETRGNRACDRVSAR